MQINLSQALPRLPHRSTTPSAVGSTDLGSGDGPSSPRAVLREEEAKLAFLTAAPAAFALMGEAECDIEFELLCNAAKRYEDELESLSRPTTSHGTSSVAGGAGGAGGSGVASAVGFTTAVASSLPSSGTAPATSGKQDLIYTVFFVGSSGSGKTSFRQCCTHTVMKTLPEVKPSVLSSASLFYFTSDKKESLELQVVDSGPQHSPRSAASHFLFHGDALYLIHISLATIMQLGKKGNHRILFHDSDKSTIRAHLAAVAAAALPQQGWNSTEKADSSSTGTSPHATRGAHADASCCSVAVICTHMDQLNDSSTSAVEKVLKLVNDFVTDEVEALRVGVRSPIRLIGSFAVSCDTHQCVTENRGGPKTIKALWSFFCELCVKEARILRSKLARKWGDDFLGKSARMVDVLANASFASNPQLQSAASSSQQVFAMDGNCGSVNSLNASMAGPSVVENGSRCELSIARVYEKQLMRAELLGMLRKAKSELNVVLVQEHVVAQAAYALGNHSKALLRSVIEQLMLQSEASLLDHPHHNRGSRRALLLVPHLVTRAAHALFTFATTAGYPRASRQKLLPQVVVEECESADSCKLASQGIITPRLMVALSRCFASQQRDPGSRAELFATLLLATNLIVQVIEPEHNDDHLFSLDSASRFPSGLLYVAPSLVSDWASPNATSMLSSHAAARGLAIIHYRLVVQPCPAALLPHIVSRSSGFLRSCTAIVSNGAWLSSHAKLASRVWIQQEKQHMLENPGSCESLGVERSDTVNEAAACSFSIFCCSPLGAQSCACFTIEVLSEIKGLLQVRFRGCVWRLTVLAPEDLQPVCCCSNVQEELELLDQLYHEKMHH